MYGVIHRPVLLGVLTGLFLIGVAATAYASQSLGRLITDHNDTVSEESIVADDVEQAVEAKEKSAEDSVNGMTGSAKPAEEDKSVEIKDTEEGSRTSIVIESYSETTVNGETSVSEPEVTINGQAVELPRSGRSCERTRDENNNTRICARVDSDGGASINISTNESVEVEED